MKNLARFLSFLAILAIGAFQLSPVLAYNPYYGDDDYSYYYGDYGSSSSYSDVVERMDYEMTVNENHSYDIHITEVVDFSGYNHGIYRAIPRRGTFYREVDGKSVASDYSAVIKDVRIESGQPYTTETEGDAYIIKIGDANRVVTGEQTYSYSYTYDPGDDGFDSFDDVYQSILSPYLENPVEQLNLTIHMPKPFEASDVHFYSGDYDTTTNALNFEYQVNGTTITGHSTQPIYPGELVSLRIVLPQGYFVGVTTGRELLPVFYGVAAVAMILGILIYLFKGRGKKPLEPVMFYAPDDFDSAQVGYILSSNATTESMVSLLIFFADKGWLTIENLSSNPKKPDYVLHKIQDIPVSRPSFERTIFNALFSRGDNPKVSSLTERRSVGDAFITAQEQLEGYFSGKRAIISPSTYGTKMLIMLLVIVTSLAAGLAGTYYATRYLDFIVLLFLTIPPIFGPAMMDFSVKKKGLTGGILVTLLGAGILGFLTQNLMCFAVTLVVNLVLGLCGHYSLKRTEQGNKWLGECRGFRHFIETAELNRLELLVEENPEYYYNILPYAYAMGLTDKWAKNFEGIALAPPTWYVDPYYTNFDLFRAVYFMNMFNRGVGLNISNIHAESLRNMGSGGFGGGGFSGGGFGGGAGGGLGGGSW